MAETTDRRLVVVVRPTRLDELVARFNTIGQAKFYVESLGGDFFGRSRCGLQSGSGLADGRGVGF